MSWRECKSLLKLRERVNALWPDRDKESDGTVGDPSHSQRKSDHNPNVHGVVTAMDIDRELAKDGSVTVATLVERLQASRDRRIKYLIWNGQITLPGDITKWKPYHGANAHKHHCHISASSDPALYDDESPWNIGDVDKVRAEAFIKALPVEPTFVLRDLRIGDRGDDVKRLQLNLGVTADGDFGLKTKKAVLNVQVANKLRADGIVGPATRKALHLQEKI